MQKAHCSDVTSDPFLSRYILTESRNFFFVLLPRTEETNWADVMTSLRRAAEWVVKSGKIFLCSLADKWYQDQIDATQLLTHVKQRGIFGLNTLGLIANSRERFQLELSAESLCLDAVSEMLKNMGFEDDEINVLLYRLCTDESISDETREEMVKSYITYTDLEPFCSKTNISVNGFSESIESQRTQAYLQFIVCVQNCLPVNSDPQTLETLLAKVLQRVSAEKCKSSLLQVSGILETKENTGSIATSLPNSALQVTHNPHIQSQKNKSLLVAA